MFLAQLIPDIGEFIQGLVNSILAGLVRFFDNFIKLIIDAVAAILPSTPDGLTLSSLVNNFVDAADTPFGVYYLYQAAAGISAILFVAIIYKIVKILPFT